MSDNKFSSNDNEAEMASRAEPVLSGGQDEPKEEYSRTAKSWAMYLQEAGENAKDQAEVWKTGLESLLIFAGLFAGVITSFLVESRQKLRLDDQEALLMDIRSALRNEPPPNHEGYTPTLGQLWVNGLFFASLLVTLFSAIVAVLARSWLVDHLPIAARSEATDAYKRWILDERAERWKLQKVITGIPLLMQLAFFLFALGLGIQTYDDHRDLGIFVIALVSAGTLLYLAVTILPLLLPPDSCPFHTPLTDILQDLQGLFLHWLGLHGYIRPKFTSKGLSDTLTKILYEGLINSRKPELIDEAVFELNRRPLQPQRVQFFATSDTPAISIQRIWECMSMRFKDLSQRDKIIGAHLRTLHRLVGSWEENGYDKGLWALFEEEIGPDGCLGRWNFFPESLRAPAFTVRVPLYLAFNRDFEDTMSPGKEWETVTRHIHPSFRLHFMASACRGIVQGRETMRLISSFSAVHLMAQSYVALNTGRKTKWGLSKHHGRVHTLCQAYVWRLFKAIDSMCAEGSKSFVEIPPEVDGPNAQASLSVANAKRSMNVVKDPLDLPGCPPPHLLSALTSLDWGVRNQWISVLISLACQGRIESSTMDALLRGFFNTMFDDSYKPETIPECMDAASKLCKTVYREATIRVLSERLDKALEGENLVKSGPLQSGMKVVRSLVKKITTAGDEASYLEEVLWSVVPRVIAIDLTCVFPAWLERWGWLKDLCDWGDWGCETQMQRAVDRIQGLLCVGLAKAVAVVAEDSEAKERQTLALHERLNPIADLLAITMSSISVVTFETLQQALIPHLTNVVTLALQPTGPNPSLRHPTFTSRVSVLVALAERVGHDFAFDQWDATGAELPLSEHRDRVYQTLQMSLQEDLDTDTLVGFMDALLDHLETIEDEIAEWLQSQAPSSDGEAVAVGGILEARSMEPVVTEVLRAFIGPRWRDIKATRFLLRRAAAGKHQDGFVACLPNSFVDLHKSCDEDCARVLVELVEVLVVGGWRDGVRLLVDLSVDQMYVSAQDAAIGSLQALLDKAESRDAVLDAMRSKMQALASYMHTADEAEQDLLIVKWKRFMISMSTNVEMRPFCSASLSRINEEGFANQTAFLSETGLTKVAASDYKDQLEEYAIHPSMHLRRSAMGALAETALEFDAASIVKRLAQKALTDLDESLKLFCLDQLAYMASDVKTAPLVIDVLKHLDQEEVDSTTAVAWRKQWAILLTRAARHGTFVEGMIQLVRIALKDEHWEVRVVAVECLGQLADDHTESIVTRTILARNVMEVVRDISPPVRKAWATTLRILSVGGHWQEGQQALIHIALFDFENYVRHQAYQELDLLLKPESEPFVIIQIGSVPVEDSRECANIQTPPALTNAGAR